MKRSPERPDEGRNEGSGRPLKQVVAGTPTNALQTLENWLVLLTESGASILQPEEQEQAYCKLSSLQRLISAVLPRIMPQYARDEWNSNWETPNGFKIRTPQTHPDEILLLDGDDPMVARTRARKIQQQLAGTLPTELHIEGDMCLEPAILDDIVAGLRHNCSLVELSVTAIDSLSAQKLIQVISENATLERLTFWQMCYSADDLHHLLKSSKIKQLTLIGCDFEPDALSKHGSHLTELRVQDCPFTGEQALAQAFSGMLEKSSGNLRVLALPSNLIDDDGAKLLATALTRNQKLRYLDISYNSIGREGALHFVDCLESHNFTLINLVHAVEDTEIRAKIRRALVRNSNIRYRVQAAMLAFVGCMKRKIPTVAVLHVDLLKIIYHFLLSTPKAWLRQSENF